MLPPDTPLVLACRFGQSSIVEAMIAAGADVNHGGVNSPLEVALRDAGWDMVQLLLHSNAKTSSISGLVRVLLKNKRDGFSVGQGTDYADAENKIMLLKGYGLDLDSTVDSTQNNRAGLVIPSLQPWLLRV